VADAWAARRGGERGFSMGRFDPDYIAAQRVYAARQAGRIIAFVTFHDHGRAWVLDLMRSVENAPNGTMHALVAAAIADAAGQKCRALSLAALPSGPRRDAFGIFAQRLVPADGLRQFKLSFAPRLAPRYLMAPTPSGLVLSGLDIIRRVHRPVPLAERTVTFAHDRHEHAWNSVSS
jgi:phosphatidylglycerol lysyltransferase